MPSVSNLSQQNGGEWGSQNGPTIETKTGCDDLSEAEVALQRLVDCYRETDDTSKIPEIIQVSRKGLAMTLEGTEQRPMWLHALAWSLYQSYKHIDASGEYIKEAVSLEKKAIESSLDFKDIDKYSYWLGQQLGDYFYHTEDMSVLQEAIADGSSRKASQQINLAVLLKERYARIGDEQDFIDASANMDEALSVVRSPHHDFLLWYAIFAELYDLKHLNSRALKDLERSVELRRQALSAIDDDPEGNKSATWKLAITVDELFNERRDVQDLQDAIRLTRESVAATAEDDPEWLIRTRFLFLRLHGLYLGTGQLQDLEESIILGTTWVEKAGQDHPDWSTQLNNISAALTALYERTGSPADLDAAIRYGRESLEVTPKDEPGLGLALSNMAMALSDRSRASGSLEDLDEAVYYARLAVDATPEDDPARHVQFHNLASVLHKKYTRSFGDITLLNETIDMSRKAIADVSEDHPDFNTYRNRLASALDNRHTALRREVANATINSGEGSALSLTPEIGELFVTRYTPLRIEEDMEKAVENIQLAILPLCPEYKQAYEIGRAALDMVPMLAAYLLSHAAGLAANTAEALSILEQGHIKELRNVFPNLAEEFVRLRDELDSSTGSNVTEKDSSTYGVQGRRRRDAGKAFDGLLVQIRENPGFEDFLGPLTTNQMLSAADCGPVVVLNSSWMGVDAIIIQEDHLMSFVFPEVKDFQTLQFMPEHEYGSVQALEILWNAFMSNILDHLGFTETPEDGQDWPHVWWVPTGPLSRLPIHAAGLHLERSGKTVMDRVICSYAPSVKALVHGRRRQEIRKGPAQALLVAMENTQSQAPLPKAKEEVELVSNICESMSVTPVIAGSDKKEALEHLRSSKIFHFAGHGHTDRSNPSKSHLCFSNASDPLTVANLLELNLHEESPFLAYLSACSTGRVQDEQFIDESIHLISACQLAGFRHIIGTLWKVQDEHCVDVARITYETIREGGMTDDSVCRGLHRATRAMRDIWLDSMEEDGNSALRGEDRKARDIIPCEEDEPAPAYWVPYVHFGI
ncbi:CHAT domain-containing protein [Fusarium flagelliforme]|uniref:CHAT domain-containing protein n=1 Tax=Fusarium flagelliforme TaxID=2675880 RepID=UPI001E8DBBA4|nr:CHAT domain-containing protein [Fusarium flagelliforme]KAH7184602.1 CHAT domain-containing protein [Fusarium flagelliforme]